MLDVEKCPYCGENVWSGTGCTCRDVQIDDLKIQAHAKAVRLMIYADQHGPRSEYAKYAAIARATEDALSPQERDAYLAGDYTRSA